LASAAAPGKDADIPDEERMLTTPAQPDLPDAAYLQAAVAAAPFHRWLSLKVVRIDADGIELAMPWREELISNPKRRTAHGGILASLVDLSGFYALLAAGLVVRATADLRVDYHRPAAPGNLRARSWIVKTGSRISVADTEVLDEDRVLLASGRGAYLMD
jgi:uncharacterized protein (TIGR00369 family)